MKTAPLRCDPACSHWGKCGTVPGVDINRLVTTFSYVDSDDDLWADYLSARREKYLAERRQVLGQEYDTDRQRWDSLFEQEWLLMAEALWIEGNDPIKQQLGSDYLERKLMANLEISRQVASDFAKIQVGDKLLPFVHYEDFIMLSNQGIFRLEEFALDKERRWRKNVAEDLAAYQYQIIDTINLFGEEYLHVIKK